MSVYAPAPAFAERKPHPRTLVLIVAVHAAVIAAVMTAKMAVPPRFVPTRTVVDFIPLQPVQPDKVPPKAHQPTRTVTAQQPVRVPAPQPEIPTVMSVPTPLPNPVPQFQPVPLPQPLPQASVPAPTGPRFVTPESEVKPPYPQQKLFSGEEAVLRLKLTIDQYGRVTAVDPVGNADPIFLAAARRHILAHWRYRPATEGGRPVPSSTVITLQFELD